MGLGQWVDGMQRLPIPDDMQLRKTVLVKEVKRHRSDQKPPIKKRTK
jgi:hypothetical protein